MSPPTAPIAVASWPRRSAWVESISTRRVMLYWALGVTANVAPCGARERAASITGGPAPGVSSRRARHRRPARDRAAPPDRRQQPRVPGVPRPAGHDLDGRRLPHERPLRPRRDDDEDARRGAARARGRGLGRAGPDLPPRAGADLQGQPPGDPGPLPRAGAPLPADDGGLRLRQHRARRLRGRRRHRHARPAGRGGRGAGRDPHRRPRRLPAREPARQRHGHGPRGHRHHGLHARTRCGSATASGRS